jgi:hypothetical protein
MTMAKLNSNAKTRTPDVRTDPATKVVAERLDAQYARLLQAASVVHTIRNAVELKDNEGQDNDLVAMFSTLCVVEEMLTDIAGQLEPPFMLRQEVAHG